MSGESQQEVSRLKGFLRAPWQIVYHLYVMPLREVLIDFTGLSLGLRALAVFGYGVVFLLLGLTLLFELLRDHLYMVSYENVFSETVQIKEVPLLVMLVAVSGFVLGWAYILTGATDSRRRVFVPVMGLFAIQLVLLFPLSEAMFVWGCAAPALLIAVTALYLFTRDKQLWRDYPLAEFTIWVCVMLFFVALFWFSRLSLDAVAKDLDFVFGMLAMLNLPLWIGFGLTVVDAAVSVAASIVTALRRLFPGEVLRALTVFLVLARPALTLLIISVGGLETTLGAAFFLDTLISVLPLVIVMVILAVLGRWNNRNAAIVLALSFVSIVFILSLFLLISGADNADLFGMTLEGLGVLSPLLLFVMLMAHGVLSLGSAFANQDGRIVPRSGRIGLSFGLALLVIALTIFSVNTRDVITGQLDDSFQQATDSFFGLSVFFLGLPYLAWIIWRRRDRLVGSEVDFEDLEPVFSGLGRASGRVWLAAGIVAVVLLSCILCLVAFVLSNPALM